MDTGGTVGADGGRLPAPGRKVAWGRNSFRCERGGEWTQSRWRRRGVTRGGAAIGVEASVSQDEEGRRGKEDPGKADIVAFRRAFFFWYTGFIFLVSIRGLSAYA